MFEKYESEKSEKIGNMDLFSNTIKVMDEYKNHESM